jgi:hexosaminidase
MVSSPSRTPGSGVAPPLAPSPRSAEWTGRHRPAPAAWTVHAPAEWQVALTPFIRTLDGAEAGPSGPWTDRAKQAAVRIRREPAAHPSPEAYRLELARGAIRIAAAHPVGAARALSTLRQLARAGGGELPLGVVDDAPAFAVRGVMLDISRDRVPTMAELFARVDLFAELKFNRLELYTEHTFAYVRHPEVWAGADPMTPEEIRALDAYCAARFIELVPNQNSFGHMERWLKHPRHAPLAEAPEGWVAPWSPERRPPSTLCPGDPRSLALIAELYDELLPNFSSRALNVGGDEPWELGQGRSRAGCAEVGVGRVYLEYLLGLHRLCAERGRTMYCWSDLLQRHPELIPELPDDVVVLDWGYEPEHPFESECGRLAAAGRRFFVCPGTSSWNSLAGRPWHALHNLRRAAGAGARHGAAGYMVTDWGDGGHWQPASVSWLPWTAAAEHAWRGAQGADDRSIVRACSRQVLGDGNGGFLRAAIALGDAHRRLRQPTANATALFRLLTPVPPETLRAGVSAPALARTEALLRAADAALARAPLDRPDAELVRAEFRFSARGLLLACRRARAWGAGRRDPALARDVRAWADEHRRLWGMRSRPGGLADSAARMEALADVC